MFLNMIYADTSFPPSEILITEKLSERTHRSADLEREGAIMVELAFAMARSPETILQTLVERAMQICGAGSAGISLDESSNGEPFFQWKAVAGKFKPFLHAKLPRKFSPCGVVIDQKGVQLMTNPENFYPYVKDLALPIHEVLLVPFFKNDKAVGTIWVVAHDKSKSFDSEDSRLMHSLARFMSSAIQAHSRIAD
jgi:GAF domain-containing protein